MKTNIKIDKLTLSAITRDQEIYYSTSIPGYNCIMTMKYKDILKTKDGNLIKYKNIVKFQHKIKKITLIICTLRKKKAKLISPVYLLFYTDYFTKITLSDVVAIEKYFNIPFRVSSVHLATDIISNREGVYDRVICSLKPGRKKQPQKSLYVGTRCFGQLSSGNQLVVCDKSKQLKYVKDTDIAESVCRLELRLKVPVMNNHLPSIHTTQDLADYDWGFVYPNFYSFHFRSKKLKRNINSLGEDWHKPIWELRDIMVSEGVTPSKSSRRIGRRCC